MADPKIDQALAQLEKTLKEEAEKNKKKLDAAKAVETKLASLKSKAEKVPD